jgi:hypothetical protein
MGFDCQSFPSFPDLLLTKFVKLPKNVIPSTGVHVSKLITFIIKLVAQMLS